MTSQRLVSSLVLALASVLAACGSGDETSSEDLEAACLAVCDKQGQATGCGDLTAYLDACDAVCGAITVIVSGDCRAKGLAAYRCQDDLSYMCIQGGEVPLPTTAGCEAEAEAYADCIDPGGE